LLELTDYQVQVANLNQPSAKVRNEFDASVRPRSEAKTTIFLRSGRGRTARSKRLQG